MKFVKYDEVLDYREYISYFEKIRHMLPVGALNYLSQPGHFDFTSENCPHDLIFSGIHHKEIKPLSVDIFFKKNRFKHEMNMILTYLNIRSFQFQVYEGDTMDFDTLGDFLIDEVLIESEYLSHEIQFTNGFIIAKCHDLKSDWIEELPIYKFEI